MTTKRDLNNALKQSKINRIETTTDRKIVLYKIANALHLAGKDVCVEDLQKFSKSKITPQNIRTTHKVPRPL